MTWAVDRFYDDYWSARIARGDHQSPRRVKLRHQQAAAWLRETLGPRASGSDSRPAAPGGAIRIIDLGSGDGIMGQLLSGAGMVVTAADVSPRALAIAATTCASTRIMNLDTDQPDHADRRAFDGVVCLEVLEHLERPTRAVRTAFDLCRPGGAAVFSFPNLFSWKNRLSFLRGRWPVGYTTYDPREHLQVIELSTCKRWLREAGFVLAGVQITPDLPRFSPARKLMFSARSVLARCAPSLAAMQILIQARRPDR